MILKLLFSPLAQERNMSSALDHVDGYIRYPAPPWQTQLNPKDVVLGRIRERENLSLFLFYSLHNHKNSRRDMDRVRPARVLINRAHVIGLLRGIPSSRDVIMKLIRAAQCVLDPGRTIRGSFSSSCERLSEIAASLAFSCPRFRFGSFSSSTRERERQGGLSLLLRPYCARVNYVRINAES